MPGGGFWPTQLMRKPVPRVPTAAPPLFAVTRMTVAQLLWTTVVEAAPGSDEPVSSATQPEPEDPVATTLGQTCGEEGDGWRR